MVYTHWTSSLVIFQTDGIYFLLRTLAEALPQAWSLFLAVFQFIHVFPVLQVLLTPRLSLTASCFGDYLLSGTTGSSGCTSHVALLRTPICVYTYFCETCILPILTQVYTHIAMRCFFFFVSLDRSSLFTHNKCLMIVNYDDLVSY